MYITLVLKLEELKEGDTAEQRWATHSRNISIYILILGESTMGRSGFPSACEVVSKRQSPVRLLIHLADSVIGFH